MVSMAETNCSNSKISTGLKLVYATEILCSIKSLIIMIKNMLLSVPTYVYAECVCSHDLKGAFNFFSTYIHYL